MKLAVAGTGYVGLVTGVCLAEIGHHVTCVDTNQKKVELMQSGKSPIYEPGLEELMVKNQERLTYTTDFESAYKEADVIFIGVGTPENEDGSANLDYVYQVTKEIAESIQKNCIVVVKSTVPIGTNDQVEELLKAHLKHDVEVEVASNPEFLAQGTAVRDTLKASRIVLGVESKHAEAVLKQVYDGFETPYVVTNRRSAEMIKYASNDFLALKLSYINEISNLCEIVGANIEDVAKGMGMDSRIGNKFLGAGIGYGGSCFPKDTKALHWLAQYHGYELKTIKAAIEVNEEQKVKLIEKLRRHHSSFKGLKVAVLGLTFKPGTDDLREAPSLENIPILLEEGAEITAYDPVGIENFKKFYPTQIDYVNTPEEALKDAEVCMIFTEWDQVKELAPETFINLMEKPLVLDGRNCYMVQSMNQAGIQYESMGR